MNYNLTLWKYDNSLIIFSKNVSKLLIGRATITIEIKFSITFHTLLAI